MGSLQSTTIRPDNANWRRLVGWALLLAVVLFTLASSPLAAATITVTNTDDSGAGSLREAILTANANDTIVFGAGLAGQTITLSQELAVTQPLIIDASATANVTVSGGGAVRVFSAGAPLTLIGFTVSNGKAPTSHVGGGIFTNQALTLTAMTISNNQATGSGGGVYLSSGGSALITESTLKGNSSFIAGGALFGQGNSVTIIRSSIYSNTAEDGGGILVDGGSLLVDNSTISGNQATSSGGGIWVASTDATVRYSSLINNSARTTGGGLFVMAGNVALDSTVIAASPSGGDCSGTVSGPGYNFIQDGANACGLTDSVNNNLIGQAPDLAPLGAYGGPTWTHAGYDTSNLLNHGNPATCPAVDQRGFTRPHGPGCDIGAVETMAAAPTSTPTQTATATLTLVSPTATPTNTAIPPTATPTNTPFPPTVTPTNTPLPPTVTPTNTPFSPTVTPTNTPTQTGLPTNQPPQIFGTANDQVVIGQAYTFDAEALDSDGNILTFSIQNKPVWASFDAATGVLSGTPTASDAGTTSGIIISVSDGAKSTDLPAFNLTVVANETALDEKPVFGNAQPPTSVNVGETFYYDPKVFDPESEPLIFSASLPAWLSINPTTGIINGIPQAGDMGHATIVLTATESSNLLASAVNAPYLAADNEVVLTANVQINNRAMPYSPSGLTFCAPVGNSFQPQTILIPKTTFEEDDEVYFSHKLDFGYQGQFKYDGSNSTIIITPLAGGLSSGVNARRMTFTLRGVAYTVPVTIILGASCNTGAVQSPPSASSNPSLPPRVGNLEIGRNQLEFAGVVGQPIAAQSLSIKSTGAALQWNATADRSWVQLSSNKGETPATVQVNINAAILAAGEHTAKVTFADAQNAKVVLTIILRLTAPPVQDVSPAGNILLTALEVTQGLQNQMNEMPLVQNRPTIVLAHLKLNAPNDINNVKAKLTVKRPDGTLLGTVSPENQDGKIDLYVPTESTATVIRDNSLARYYLEENFFFRLKPEWLNGTLVLEFAGVSHTIGCAEISDAAPDCKVQANFSLQRPRLPVKIFLGTQPGYTTDQTAVKKVIRVLEAMFPLAKVDVVATEPWKVGYAVQSNDQARKALDALAARWRADGKPKLHYLAIFEHPSGQGGVAYTHGDLAMVVTKSDVQTLIAHEFVHNFGLGHMYTDPKKDVDPQFPAYVADSLSAITSGPKAYFGFVTNDLAVSDTPNVISIPYGWRILPNAEMWYGGDVMSGGFWLSEFTYRRVLEKAPTMYGFPATEISNAAAPAADTPVTLISGRITSTTAAPIGVIDMASADMVSSAPQPNSSGNYRIRLENSSGGVVATLPFSLTQVIDGDEPFSYFSVVAPQALDKNSPIARLVLLAQNTPLYTLNAPVDGAPLINSLTAQEGGNQITVTINLQDGQPLHYQLDYSPNGIVWHEAAIGKATTGSTQIIVNKDNLPGGNASYLRLFVGDGFYTTILTKETTSSFTVPNHRPVVTLDLGVTGSYMVGNQSLTLRGSATDLEDGVLTGTNLLWKSDRDGVLGTGEELVIVGDDLSEGQHVISLEATDSNGLSNIISRTAGSDVNTAQLAQSTAEFALPNSSSFATIEILRNAPYAPPTLESTDVALQVEMGKVVTTTIFMRSGGDSNVTLNWSVVTNSLPAWMTLAKSSGQTPDKVTVTVSAVGLAAGEYSGVLTLQSTFGGSTQTEYIPYTVVVGETAVVTTPGEKIYLPLISR